MDNLSSRLFDLVSLVVQADTLNRRVDAEPDFKQVDALVDEFELLLKNGADPNAMNESGHTALGLIAQSFRGSGIETGQIRLAGLLMEHGANPMRFDQPLGRGISHFNSSSLVTSTLMAISRAETSGEGLRDDNGGNVLHYLADVDPLLATWQLEEDIYAIADGDLENLYFPAPMLNSSRESDGSTPLEVLWKTGNRKWMEDEKPTVWRMTNAMIKLGADPFRGMDDNASVVDEIDRLVSAGKVLPDTDAWPPLAARLSQHRMATTITPRTPHSTLPPRRI